MPVNFNMEHVYVRTGWECPRCHNINGPHVDQCSCSKINLRDKPIHYDYIRVGDIPPSAEETSSAAPLRPFEEYTSTALITYPLNRKPSVTAKLK